MLAALVMPEIVTHKRKNRNEFSSLLIDSDILILVSIIVFIIINVLLHIFLGLSVSHYCESITACLFEC